MQTSILTLSIFIVLSSSINSQQIIQEILFPDELHIYEGPTDSNGNTVFRYSSREDYQTPIGLLENGQGIFVLDENMDLLFTKRYAFFGVIPISNFDANGNLYVSFLLDEAREIEGTQVDPLGLDNLIMIKYDCRGNFISLKQNFLSAADIFSPSQFIFGNHLYLPLYYTGFDYSEVGLTSVNPGGSSILAKFDLDFNLVDYLQFPSFEYIVKIQVDNDENIHTYMRNFENEIILKKFDKNLEELWDFKFHFDEGFFTCLAYDVDPIGDPLIGCTYKDTAFIDSNIFVNDTSFNDSVVLKLDGNSGDLKWINKIGGNGSDEIMYIETDAKSNVYISAAFREDINISDTSIIALGPDKNGVVFQLNSDGKLSGFLHDTYGEQVLFTGGPIFTGCKLLHATEIGTNTVLRAIEFVDFGTDCHPGELCSTTSNLSENPILDFNISPNPTSGFINVSNPPDSESYQYRIINNLGQTIKNGHFTETIDFTASPGVYYLELFSQEIQKMKKFILE